MMDVSVLDTIRGLWDYHWWANRRLFEVAAALGEEAAGREVGPQFSFPTLRRIFGHVYGADWIWLCRWRGVSPARLPGAEFETMATLRERWDGLEEEQRGYLTGLTPGDLGRQVQWKSIEGRALELPLWVLLHHVPNHATHHRSEIATMITMISGSPPDSGLVTYHLERSGQGDPAARRR